MTLRINPALPKVQLGLLDRGCVLHHLLDRASLQAATIFADKTPYENVGTSANVPVFTTDRMGQANRAVDFGTGLNITAVALEGGDIRCTTNGDHGLAVGERITISGTTDYNGNWTITAVSDATHFDVTDTYTSSQTGAFVRCDYINCENDDSLNMTDEITISMWMKPQATQPENAQPLTRAPHNWKVRLFANTVYLAYTVGGVYNQYGTSFSYNADEWIYIAFSYSSISKQVITYKNGVQQTPVTLSGLAYYTLTPSNGIFYLGCANIGERYFNGSMADVRIYNRALSESEITSLYETYRPKLIV